MKTYASFFSKKIGSRIRKIKMPKQFLEFKKKHILIYMFILFFFTLCFSILIPYGGDDWNNYLYKGSSIIDAFKVAIGFYNSFEGRIFSRVFDILLVSNQILWALINASLMTFLYYLLYKNLNINAKIFSPLLLLSMLFVDMQTYAQVYVWKTGNITYFIPMVYAFYLVFKRRYLFENKELIIKKYEYLLVPLTFIFSMFVENVSVGIVMICLLNLIFYFLKYRKIDKVMLLCLISSIMGLLFMAFSPGTMSRLAENDNFASLSFMGKIFYNIPNLIDYTFIKNPFMLLLMIIIMLLLINSIRSKIIRIISTIFITIIPLLTICARLISYTRLELIRPFKILLDVSRWYICLYWIIFLILFLILIYYILKNGDKIKLLYYTILAVSSNGAMMLSPIWGGRTACFTTYMLYILLLYVLFNLNLKIYKSLIIKRILNIILSIFVMFFTFYSIWIYKLNLDRNKYINYQIENNVLEYEIIILPSYFTWNLNTWGSSGNFAYNFKHSYGIPEDAELIYVKRKDVEIDLDNINSSNKIEGLR